MKKCDNCGLESPTTQQDGNFIDGGLSVDLLNMGHYGGMWDNFPFDGNDRLVHICHDCSVTFLRALPGLAKLVMPIGGGHPNQNEQTTVRGTDTPSCCEFAWTWNCDELDDNGQYQVYYGEADGGWRKISWKD